MNWVADTPTGAPILGPVDGIDGLLLATGHHRNGVLLSAVTGEIIGALALGQPSPIDISPFMYDGSLAPSYGLVRRMTFEDLWGYRRVRGVPPTHPSSAAGIAGLASLYQPRPYKPPPLLAAHR